MVTYPGLAVPVIRNWLSRDASQTRYAAGSTFQIGKIELVANTGTYIDAPFHRYEGGKDVSDYPLQAVANLEGVAVRATERAGRALDPGVFRGRDLGGKAVLVHTGWDVHWRSERYGTGHPFLTRAAAEHLIAAGATLVGIDSLNIDDAADGARPVHSLLLAAGDPVLAPLWPPGGPPAGGFPFYAGPPPREGMGGVPGRGVAVPGG